MKPKEAFYIIRNSIMSPFMPSKEQEAKEDMAYKVIDDLLAKAEPTRAVEKDGDFYCPNCHHIAQYYNQTYCDICGQAIDWSNEK